MKAKNVTFEPVGLNNRTDPIDMLPVELTVAENVDLRRGKSARRRKGGTQVLAGKFYSFWNNGSTAYVGRDNAGLFTLNEFLPDFTLRQLTTLASGAPLALEQVNAVTAVSNGVDLGFISNDTFLAPTAPTAQHMIPTVAGEILTSQNGRLFIARGNVLYYTVAHDLETMDNRYCRIPMPKNLTMAVGLDGGIWVSYAGVIAFLQGAGPDEYKFIVKADYSAVKGTAVRTKTSLFLKDQEGEAVIFMTSKGVCIGTESGQLLPITEDQISAGIGQSGAGLVREQNGYVHYLGAVQDPNSAVNAYVPKSIIVDT